VARNVVCISHATGSGGEEVGRLVAERLGFLYVDEEIVAQAASEGRIDPRDVADEERRKSLAARILDAMAESGGEAWALGGTPPPRVGDELSSADVRALIRETILQTAARGRVVIVAHAASHAIGQREETLRVLVTGSPEAREKRVAEREARNALTQARRAKVGELVATSNAKLEVDPVLSIRSALAAAVLAASSRVEDALRSALDAFRVRGILQGGGGPVNSAVFNPEVRS